MGLEAAAAVESDITVLLSGKSYDQLISLQRQIQDKLTSGEPVDTDYWEGLLKKVLVWKAKVSFLDIQFNNHVHVVLSGKTQNPTRSCCAQQA